MSSYAALDVSQETTAICVVDDAGRIRAEKKVPTCPEPIAANLNQKAPDSSGSGSRLTVGVRVQEGEDRRGPEDGRDPARNVEDQHPIPLESGGGGISARLTFADASPTGRLARDRPP